FVSRRRRSHFPMVLGCTSRTQKRTEDCLTRSAQRHRTTPSLSSSGPLITTSRSSSAWLGVSNLGLPGDVSVARPSTPHSLYRSTQSRNVCLSTHANSAASARDHPSITNEIACTLRACPASFMSDAIRRSSCAVWLSRVTFTGDPITLSPGPNSVRRYESNQRRAVNRAPAPGESLFMRVGIIESKGFRKFRGFGRRTPKSRYRIVARTHVATCRNRASPNVRQNPNTQDPCQHAPVVSAPPHAALADWA